MTEFYDIVKKYPDQTSTMIIIEKQWVQNLEWIDFKKLNSHVLLVKYFY